MELQRMGLYLLASCLAGCSTPSGASSRSVPVTPVEDTANPTEEPPGEDEPAPVTSVHGSLPREAIQGVVRQHRPEVRQCYEAGLMHRPQLSGEVVVRWVISRTGSVTAAAVARSNLGAPVVEECITGQVRTWVFPPPDGGGIVTVTYPFQLRTS